MIQGYYGEYMFRHNLSLIQFAKKIDYSPSYVSAVCSFKKKPSSNFLEKAEIFTERKLNASDMLAAYREHTRQPNNTENA